MAKSTRNKKLKARIAELEEENFTLQGVNQAYEKQNKTIRRELVKARRGHDIAIAIEGIIAKNNAIFTITKDEIHEAENAGLS